MYLISYDLPFKNVMSDSQQYPLNLLLKKVGFSWRKLKFFNCGAFVRWNADSNAGETRKIDNYENVSFLRRKKIDSFFIYCYSD